MLLDYCGCRSDRMGSWCQGCLASFFLIAGSNLDTKFCLPCHPLSQPLSPPISALILNGMCLVEEIRLDGEIEVYSLFLSLLLTPHRDHSHACKCPMWCRCIYTLINLYRLEFFLCQRCDVIERESEWLKRTNVALPSSRLGPAWNLQPADFSRVKKVL